MADEDLTHDVEQGLQNAKTTLQYLQARILAGEEVDEKELTALARTVATYIEEVRSRLQNAVESQIGPIPQERVREAMKERLTPEQYAEWLEHEEERNAFREEVKREKSLREQLSDREGEDGE